MDSMSQVCLKEEKIQQKLSNELDDQAKHIENFILQMKKKIVGGGADVSVKTTARTSACRTEFPLKKSAKKQTSKEQG